MQASVEHTWRYRAEVGCRVRGSVKARPRPGPRSRRVHPDAEEALLQLQAEKLAVGDAQGRAARAAKVGW